MVHRLAVSFIFLAAISVSGGALADASGAFAQMRDRAQQLDNLGAFLERYVGGCTDPSEKAACESNARKARAELTGKTFFIALDDSASRMLSAGGYDQSSREFRIDLVPFFESGGLALTDGAPKDQDAQGRPRMQLIPLMASLPITMIPLDIERLVRTQNLRIQPIFKPQGLWKLPAKGGKGFLEGVKAKYLAIRLTNARSGEEVALRVVPE